MKVPCETNTIEVTCQCGKRLRIKDEYRDKRIKCRTCGKIVSPADQLDAGRINDPKSSKVPTTLPERPPRFSRGFGVILGCAALLVAFGLTVTVFLTKVQSLKTRLSEFERKVHETTDQAARVTGTLTTENENLKIRLAESEQQTQDLTAMLEQSQKRLAASEREGQFVAKRAVALDRQLQERDQQIRQLQSADKLARRAKTDDEQQRRLWLARYTWKGRGLPSRHIALTGNEKGNEIRFLAGGKVGALDTDLTIDGPGSHDIHIVIDPKVRATAYAGLTFTTPCIVAIADDYTVLANKEGIVAIATDGSRWRSRKVTNEGMHIIPFFPDE